MATRTKIYSLTELEEVLEQRRHDGQRIVLCHGVFDLMHPGHVLHLKAARQHGDILVVTVTPDHFVNKGPGRPVFTQRLRLETLAAFETVDFVALNEWPTAVETIRRLKPDVYAKGRDYADPSQDLTGKIVEEEEAVRSVGGRILFTDEETFSSSNLINRLFSTLPTPTEMYLRDFRKRHAPPEVIDALQNLTDLRVLVIGEAIVDEYCYCVPLGKAPKETIIATRFASEEKFAGGVLAVANHVAGFCSKVTLVTCLGLDDAKNQFMRSKLRPNAEMHVVTTSDRPTITKRRYVDSTFLTKLFEIQLLEDLPVPVTVEREILDILADQLGRHDLVIVGDFGHGMLTEGVRALLCSSAKFLAVNTQTNSANLGFNAVTKYQRADYVCVHEGELRLALRTQYGDVHKLGATLRSEVNARSLMVTRGPNGSVLLGDDGAVHETPALSRRVVDRTGAGDAFFAITAPCVYKGYAPDVIGFVGNCVGALAVEIVCNREPIEPSALKKFVSHLLM